MLSGMSAWFEGMEVARPNLNGVPPLIKYRTSSGRPIKLQKAVEALQKPDR